MKRDSIKRNHQTEYVGSIEDAARYARETKRFAWLFYRHDFKKIVELDHLARMAHMTSYTVETRFPWFVSLTAFRTQLPRDPHAPH